MGIAAVMTASQKVDVETFAAADAFAESVEPVDDADEHQRSDE